jgi:hypothetical protein
MDLSGGVGHWFDYRSPSPRVKRLVISSGSGQNRRRELSPVRRVVMDLALLVTLKEKLVNASEFSDVMHYFFDHFGEDEEFMALGEGGRTPFLESVLTEVAKQLFQIGVVRIDMRLIHLPEQKFVHGMVTMNDKPANVFYFDDIHVGLMAVIWSLEPPETKYVRFTGRQMPRNLNPSIN